MNLIDDFNDNVLFMIEEAIINGLHKNAISMIYQYKAYLAGQESMSSALSECLELPDSALKIIYDSGTKQLIFSEKLKIWEPLLKESNHDL